MLYRFIFVFLIVFIVSEAFKLQRPQTIASRKMFSALKAKRSVGDLSESELRGKRVFVRADLNVPLTKGIDSTYVEK